MSYKQWGALAKLLTDIRKIAVNFTPTSAGHDQQGQIVADRRRILLLVKNFKHQLIGTLGQSTTHQVIVPLIFALDEWLIKKYFVNRYDQWPLLQRSVFKTTNGGRLFYRRLDGLLIQQNVPPFVYQSYYFWLKYGFCGMYFDAPQTRQQYLRKLSSLL
ncbi:MAG: DotU family type IV/VI secretion system protein [Sedimenticola sp.]